MDRLASQAIAAAVEVAERLGLRGVSPKVLPRLLKDGSNAIVHLAPAPVVARISTTSSLLRKPAETWLRRDLDLAAFLLSQGLPVVRPTEELPPGPHISSAQTGSMAMTFWSFVVVDREHPPTELEAVAALRDLHAALRGYPGKLPFLGVLLEELPRWLRWLEREKALPAADLILLHHAHWELAHRLRAGRARLQPLHGDAHSGNLLRTQAGLLWLDFEDACVGPVAWDLATLVCRKPESADEVLAAYPDAPGWNELLPYVEARELEGAIYYQVLAQRFPERASEAAIVLAAWRKKWSLRQ